MTNLRKAYLIPAFALATALVTGLTGSAAADAAELRHQPVVHSDVVLIGDIFTGAGPAADIVVAQAPQPGGSGQLSINTVIGAAQRAGLDWQPPAGVTRITVSRPGLEVSEDHIRSIISGAIRRQYGRGSLQVTLFSRPPAIYLPQGRTAADIIVEAVALDSRTDRFTARLRAPVTRGTGQTIELSGRVEQVVYVPTLVRDIPRGATITKNDLKWMALPARQNARTVIRSMEEVVGLATRRLLRPGQPLRESDLESPALVEKGDLVTINFMAGNLSIRVIGRALQRGGKGDVIRILNTGSNKTVEAHLTGPGEAEVRSPGQIVASR